MILAKHLHQLILQVIYILEFIDHDICQALLPFLPDLLIFFKNMEREHDQIIVIQPKTFLLLIQIAVKDDVIGLCCFQIFIFQDLR